MKNFNMHSDTLYTYCTKVSSIKEFEGHIKNYTKEYLHRSIKIIIPVKQLFSFHIFLFFLFSTICCNAAITITSISTTISTCGNNGTATIAATSNKSNSSLMYEIIAGPATAPIQNNSTFSSLFPGTYTARVYDIDFLYKDQQFTISGNYLLPDLTPQAINPLCTGFSDGKIIGNAVAGKGKAPFTWEMVSPTASPPQSSDVFPNLSAGSYTIKMTDDCGNFQTRTSILVTGGSGLTMLPQNTMLNKIGCDSMVLSMVITLFKAKGKYPLTLTINKTSGPAISKKVYATVSDTINQSPGLYNISYIIPNITYNDYLNICLTDTCGFQVCVPNPKVAPFEFDWSFNLVKNCDNKLSAVLRPRYTFSSPYIYTAFKAPLIMTLLDIASNTIVDSDTCNGPYCVPTIKEQVVGRTYRLKITDGCGDVFQEDIQWPILAPPAVYIYPNVGCLDSTAVAYFDIRNFTSKVTVELLSGPTRVGSTKTGYEFSDHITYPKKFDADISSYGFSLKDLHIGSYTYSVYDTCGNKVNGSFTIYPFDIADFHYSYSIKKGCLGDNILYFNPTSQNTVGVYVIDAATNGALYYRRINIAADSLTSLTPGKYILKIFYGYEPNVGGALYSASIKDGSDDCWMLTDTITIPPYSNNTFKSNVSIFCNGSSYVEINVDSTRGVPPYKYEISSGPKTFPLQNSNTFQLPTYGDYVIRIRDACGNSNTRQISVDSAKFPPIIKKGAACTGGKIVLKGVTSSYFEYQWQKPNGSVYTGDSLVINPLGPADTGTYIITKKVTINGCSDIFKSTYHVQLHDVLQQTIPYCPGTSLHVGTHTYTLPGIYIDTLANVLGCDSIIITTLKKLPQKIIKNNVTICKGDQITVGTNTYNTTGIYKDSVQNTFGCYDITITNLKVNGIPDTVKTTICKGYNIVVGTHIYTATGIYNDTLLSSSGCDSIIVSLLTVQNLKKDSIVKTICEGENYTTGGRIYTKSGIYRDTTTTLTCDSITIVNLTVTPLKRYTSTRIICPGQSISVGTHTYKQTGIYHDTLATATCDSIVTLDLTVKSYKRNTLVKNICFGESYTVGIHTYSQSGIYSDTVATLSCDSIIALTLTVHPLPVVSLGKDTSLCAGQSLTMDAGNGYTAYYWNDNISPSAQTISTNTTGKYWVKVTNQNGCTGTDTIEIMHIYPLPTADAGPQKTLCFGSSVQLTASGGISYLWIPGNIKQATIQVNPTTTTVYQVTVYDEHNCAASDNVEVYVYPKPAQSVLSTSNLDNCFEDGPLTLQANGGKTFLWTPSGETSQSIEVIQEGTYSVTATDVNNCSYSGQIVVNDHCETKIFVPTGFSPNGDGLHDDVEIFGKNFTNFKITIFNRWGEIIFISTDRNIRWNGIYRGEEMPIGSYPWIITYASVYDPEQKEQKMNGSITLVR